MTASGRPGTDHPLLSEVHPGLVAELVTLLERAGEPALAATAGDLRLVERCACKVKGCQSIRTVAHQGPYGPGHRSIMLDPGAGMLILDVVGDQVMYIEILDRQRLRRARSVSGRFAKLRRRFALRGRPRG